MPGSSDRHADGPWGLAAVLAILMLTSGMAGCIGDEDTPDVETTPSEDEDEIEATAQTFPWGLSNCKVVVAVVPVDAAALSEHLPEGFDPVSAEDAFGLPPDPRGEGAIGLETFACDSGVGLNATVEGLAYGAVFAPVEAPGDLSLPGADVVFYKWETLVPDDPRRERLSEQGLPVVDGSTDLSGLQQAPTGSHTFDVSLTLGDASFSFTGAAGQANEDFRDGIAFVEFQAADDGFAYWASLENAAEGANSGSGTVELAADHWTSEVVGQGSTQAYMVASTNVTFEQASIVLP